MIRIGTSGFSFPDWKGNVYPEKISSKDMLSYYAYNFKFEAVEINSTYYAIPAARNMDAMSVKTPDGFEFVVKGYKGMTHDPFDGRLEKRPSEDDIRNSFQAFNEGVAPLRDSGKLGAVLLQFPVFFHNNRKSSDYILRCREYLKDIPLVVEFRNCEWAGEDTLALLRRNSIGYCTVDEPELPRLMPFHNEVTSSLGYVRFHGRNKNWFNSSLSERYNYFYSEDELREFIPKVRKMETESHRMYAFFNNCHMGFALRNAVTFRKMLNQDVAVAVE
jgi:uncharacterized protein YecE (DUF72 family)